MASRHDLFAPSSPAKYHTFMSVPGHSGGIPVPQAEHIEPSEDFTADPPVTFYRDEEEVFLAAAVKDGFSGCTGAGEATGVLGGTHGSIMINILWPGYEPFSDEVGIKAKGNGKDEAITKAVLAHEIAKIVQRFYTKAQRAPRQVGDADWDLEKIRFDRLVLHEVRHVSEGLYQPVLLFVLDADKVAVVESLVASDSAQSLTVEP